MRLSSGFHVVQRGKSKVWYAWWSDGTGRKVMRRILDAGGRPLDPATPRADVLPLAALLYAREYGGTKEPSGDSTPRSKPSASAPLPEPPPDNMHTHADLVAAYCAARNLDWDPKTEFQYGYWFRLQAEFFGAQTVIRTIKTGRVEEFKLWLIRKRKLASRTVREILGFGRRVFQWAVDTEWLDRNPFALVKPPKPCPVRDADPFTPGEVRHILFAAREKMPWFYPCVLTAALTGTRRNVLIMLDVRDFDPGEHVLRVRPEIAKQDKRYEYALPDELYEVLVKHAAGRTSEVPLFATPCGRRMSSKTFDLWQNKTDRSSHAWRRLLEMAGVRARGIHNMRSAADTNLVIAGVPLDLATLVTGHSKEIAKRHYLRSNRESQRQTIGKLANLYAVTSDPEKAPVTIRLIRAEARILAAVIRVWGEGNAAHSGADSGATACSEAASALFGGADEKLAERGEIGRAHV